MKLLLLLLGLTMITDGDILVELRGGSTPNEGNVYALNSQNKFGPVCDDSWGDDDARVVCRQLGYSGGSSTSNFGIVSSTFAMDEVRCSGDETQIQDCRYDTSDDCGGSEGAGVICIVYTSRELIQIIDEKEAIIKHKEATITNLEAEIQRKEAIIQNQSNCPINGKWSTFSEFGQCSATCGEGIKERTRTCSNPPPQNGGQHCQGVSKETENCVLMDKCPTGNVIFITGGVDARTSTEVLDPAGTSCSRITAPLPDRRQGHTISRVGGDLVLCGGDYGSKIPTSCISARSPGGPWVQHSQLTTRRYAHASVATGDAIHVFGGGSSGAHATAETLEDGASSWKKHQLPTTIGGGSCVVEIENTVYLTGEYRAKTQTWKWNTDQQWTRLADMDQTGRSGHGCATTTVRGQSLIVVAGGRDGSNHLRTSAIYDIQENTWRSTGELNQARYKGVMVNVGNELYILGGTDGRWDASKRLETIEKFNVATNEWVNTNLRMKQGRYYFAAISVNRADFC